jgi:hypothetical protein
MSCKTKNEFNDFKFVLENINKQYTVLIEQYNSVDKYIQNDILNKIKTKLIELQKESEQLFKLYSIVCNSTLWEERYYDIKNELNKVLPSQKSPSPIQFTRINKSNTAVAPQALPPAPIQNTAVALQAVPPAPSQNQLGRFQSSISSAFTPLQNQIGISQKLIKNVSQKLIEKEVIKPELIQYLYRPTFNLLFEIINSVIDKSNFAKGLYDGDDLSFNINEPNREKKRNYLLKIFTCVNRYDNSFLVDSDRINNIVSGTDSIYANEFLIKLLECMDKPLDKNIVNQVKEESFSGGKKEKTKRRKRRQNISRKK